MADIPEGLKKALLEASGLLTPGDKAAVDRAIAELPEELHSHARGMYKATAAVKEFNDNMKAVAILMSNSGATAKIIHPLIMLQMNNIIERLMSARAVIDSLEGQEQSPLPGIEEAH